jgi:hypothetical protein
LALIIPGPCARVYRDELNRVSFLKDLKDGEEMPGGGDEEVEINQQHYKEKKKRASGGSSGRAPA